MPHLFDPLAAKRLYIADLARRLNAMETATVPMHAVAYRLFARRLKTALAGHPTAGLSTALRTAPPAVGQALAQRHFDDHGCFPGADGQRALRVAQTLWQRLGKAPSR